MPAKIREEIRREIARERASGFAAIEISALRAHLIRANLHTEEGSTVDRLIVEECANAAMPIVMEASDSYDQFDAEVHSAVKVRRPST